MSNQETNQIMFYSMQIGLFFDFVKSVSSQSHFPLQLRCGNVTTAKQTTVVKCIDVVERDKVIYIYLRYLMLHFCFFVVHTISTCTRTVMHDLSPTHRRGDPVETVQPPQLDINCGGDNKALIYVIGKNYGKNTQTLMLR